MMSDYGDRSTGIIILALFTGLMGVLGLAAGAGSYVIAFYIQLLGFPAYLQTMGVFVFVLGIVYLALAYGVWTVKSWALYIYFFLLFLGISIHVTMNNTIGVIACVILLGCLWVERGVFGAYQV